jgi:F-type H+-transporting ATPase subunit epsilon
MADEPLQVELVSADSKVWSGEASFVLARTTDGELGVLPDHAPLLSVLVESVVLIRGDGGEAQVAAVDGGFISVANNRVSILAEHAELSEDIDAGQARQDLESSQGGSDEDDEDAARRVRWAEARIAATERSD